MPRLAVKKAAPKKRAIAVRAPAKSYVRKSAPLKTVKRAAAPKKAGGSALGSAIGMAIGAALGGPAGAGIGGMVGNAGGNFLSKIFGHGDYQVSNASAISQNNLLTNSANIPQFGTGKVAVKLRHREFIGDVLSSATAGAFTIQSFNVNPGLPTTFPWLSSVVGASFQQYRINGMTFEFRSMSGDALTGANTALGSVIMATDYDSADTPFTTKQQMENTEYGVSCKPSMNMMHAIECARSQTSLSEQYIRAFAVPPGADIRLYDLCKFYIASVGCQGTNVNLGELWCTYDIDVFKAIEQVPAYINPYAMYFVTAGTANCASAPFGTAQGFGGLPNGADQIGLTFTANRMSFPLTTVVGSTYLFCFGIAGSSAAALTRPVMTTGNGMYVNTNVDFGSFNSTTSSYQLYIALQYKGGATAGALPYINIANFTWTGVNSLETDIFVTQVSGNFAGTYGGQVGGILPSEEDTDSPDYYNLEEQKKTQFPQHLHLPRQMAKMKIGSH